MDYPLTSARVRREVRLKAMRRRGGSTYRPVNYGQWFTGMDLRNHKIWRRRRHRFIVYLTPALLRRPSMATGGKQLAGNKV